MNTSHFNGHNHAHTDQKPDFCDHGDQACAATKPSQSVALKPMSRATEIKVNLMARTSTVAHAQRITQLIKVAGLKASLEGESGTEDEHSADDLSRVAETVARGCRTVSIV